MKIAIINEVSARSKNPDICKALGGFGFEVYNAGMTEKSGEPELTYIHTGFMAAVLLNIGAADMVIGGCGTGQGFLISAMQYPKVFCGLITEPLDAFLFSQINGGNCISLALNKGYGWAGELNLTYIFEKLFFEAPGQGYPPERSASQGESREKLNELSGLTHKTMCEIFDSMDKEIIKRALSHEPFYRQIAVRDTETAKALMTYL